MPVPQTPGRHQGAILRPTSTRPAAAIPGPAAGADRQLPTEARPAAQQSRHGQRRLHQDPERHQLHHIGAARVGRKRPLSAPARGPVRPERGRDQFGV